MKHSLFEKIIKIETKIVNSYFYAKFNDSKIEEEYQTSTDYLNTYFRHAMNVIIFFYILGYLIYCYYHDFKEAMIICSIFTVIQAALLLCYYIPKQEFIRKLARYAIVFLFIFFHVWWLCFLAYSRKDEIKTTKIFNRLLLFSGFMYFAYLDNNLIVKLILLAINLGVYVQIYYVDKIFVDVDGYGDMIVMFMLAFMIYLLKRNTDMIARTYLLNKYSMEMVYKYLEELINSFNGYHVYFQKNEIIFINNNFKTLLADQRSKLALEYKKEENSILIPNTNEVLLSAYEFLAKLKVSGDINADSMISQNPSLLVNIEAIQNNSEYKNDHFEILGHFNLDEQKYFEVHFRKADKLDSVLALHIYDITNIKLAEKIKTENEIKHECLAKIAHEFKTPINSILGLTNQLKQSVEKQDFYKIFEHIQQIQGLSNFTLFLINDIIHYTSLKYISKVGIKVEKMEIIETLEFCKNVLNALVNCNEMKRRSVKTYLDIDTRINDLFIRSDELRLKQIFLNIISNSVKFTKHGYISISARVLDRNHICVAIKDTGVGIKDDILAAIKEKRVACEQDRENNKMGTGLGLTICNSLAERLNHKIVVRSVYGFGTTINVVIPYQHKRSNKNRSSQDLRFHNLEDMTSARLPTEYEEKRIKLNLNLDLDNTQMDDSRDTIKVDFAPHLNSEHHLLCFGDEMDKDLYLRRRESIMPKILIVDDNQHMRDTLKQLLSHIFKENSRLYNILEGNDGIDILKYVIDDQSESNRIQCVITDESMDYLNGSFAVSLLRKMQSESKINDFKVICMTSYEDEVTRNTILKAGVNYCISKPCNKKELEEILKSYKII
jgi:signal transduction histidine kinase/CheY-like chemotaxis protein